MTLPKVRDKNIQKHRGRNKSEKESSIIGFEPQHQLLLEAIPAALYTCDAIGRITSFNKSAVELWGREPVINKDLWCGSLKIYKSDGITPMALDQCPMAICLKEGRIVSDQEIVIERPDGSRRNIMPHPSPLFNKAGKVTGAVNMLVDVTEKKSAEQNTASLAAIVTSSNDAIISKTLDGIITSWNASAERLFGYKAEEMIGQPLTKLFPPDRLEEEPRILDRLKKGEVVDHFETKRVTKDKSIIDLSLTISPIRDRNGKVIGASKIARDISEKKKIILALSQSEERFRMAVESTKLGTWEYFPQTGKMIWSKECRKIYDVPEDLEMTFDFFEKHIYLEDALYADSEIRKALDPAGPGIYDTQFRIIRYSDKQPRWIKARGKVYFDELKKPEKFIGTILDNTEEKLKELQLKDSVELFRTMANNAPALIWMTGPDQAGDYFNNTWLDFTGRKLEDEINGGWIRNVHPDDWDKSVITVDQLTDDLKGFYTEYRLKRKDGQYRWIAQNSVPRYDQSKSFVGYINACMDIDEIRKLEERKDDFIKMASHELKTPITSIKGYIQLLINIYEENDEEKLRALRPTVKSSLNTIAKQVTKLTRLVSELLDLSRINSERLELNKTNFDLCNLVEEVAQEVRYTTTSHAIIVSNNSEGKINILADRDRIAQVLSNLLTNAVKYSPGAEKVDVIISTNDTFATILVKDDGIGIDEKDHSRIFERFYRVEGKSEITFPGFGIGLFIASEIVGRHEGYIELKSEKDKGSTFKVILPFQKNT